MPHIATFHIIPYRTRTLVSLFSFAVTAASGWLYVGPYAWLAELQLRAMGVYYPTITGLFALLFVLLLFMVPLRSYHLGRGTLSEAQMAADRAYDEWFVGVANLRRTQGLLLAIAMFCIGAVSGFSAWSAGALTTPTLQQLVEQDYESRFVSIPTDRLIYDDSITFDEAGTEWLIPLFTGGPAYSVFARVKADAGQHPSEVITEGTGLIESVGLDGQSRAFYTEFDTPISPKTIIVNLDNSPIEEAEMSTIFLILSLVLLVVVGVAQLVVVQWEKGAARA